MPSLRELMSEPSRFLIGTELVSVRGSMAEQSAVKARTFAGQLVDYPKIDWISITDNAGGHPQLAPTALGKPILYAGKEVVIHLTCKDLNRNGLESEAWLLNSEGFNNILAMTGDYPSPGSEGLAKPVFDLDSVGLIAMLDQMNKGLDPRTSSHSKSPILQQTNFLIGAVTTNYKLHEGEVMPQYFKLRKKVECGAQFIINQIGFDSRKVHELRLYMDAFGMKQTPLIGNVYLLNAKVARLFYESRIPGVVLTRPLLEICLKQAESPDSGRAFFCELAAKQMAVYRGLGYRGAYLGGAFQFSSIQKIIEIEASFKPDDWKQFAREILFSRPDEFYYYATDPATGLANAKQRAPSRPVDRRHASFSYWLAKKSHDLMFSRGTKIAEIGAELCEESKHPAQGPKPMRMLEHLSKGVLFQCKDCGDCSLPEIAFLCPESQCAKNQRNGPCGGTESGHCEVAGYGDCIWLRAYERLKSEGQESHLLDHAPVVQNQALRGTSAWSNFWLNRDHTAVPSGDESKTPAKDSAVPAPSASTKTSPGPAAAEKKAAA